MMKMLIRRVLALVAVLVGVITLTFTLLRLAPGDPFIGERELSPAARAEKLKQMHLDGSLPSQITRYFGRLLNGDLGTSTKYKNMPVREIIGQSLPVSLQLGGMGFLLAVGLGVPLGLVAALYKNRGLDHLAMFLALIALALPAFIVGPLLIFIFSLWLGWFPIGGWFRPATYVLPALCLALPYAATIARLMRNSLLEVLNQDFIRTARAKGLSPLEVTYGHALKAALLPVVTFLGPLAANLLTGSVVVETVFGIPGSGPYFVRAIENRDLYLLLGLVVIYCTLLVVMNFLVDLAYSFLDRRIKLS